MKTRRELFHFWVDVYPWNTNERGCRPFVYSEQPTTLPAESGVRYRVSVELDVPDPTAKTVVGAAASEV